MKLHREPKIVRLVLFSAIIFAVASAAPSNALGSCERECRSDFSSDVFLCQATSGDDPADRDPGCVKEACDDYYLCLQDCSDPLNLGSDAKASDFASK